MSIASVREFDDLVSDVLEKQGLGFVARTVDENEGGGRYRIEFNFECATRVSVGKVELHIDRDLETIKTRIIKPRVITAMMTLIEIIGRNFVRACKGLGVDPVAKIKEISG